MGVRTTVKQKPSARELQRILNKAGRKIGDLKPVHKKASILLDQWVQHNFRTEGGKLSSGRWPPFKFGGRFRPGLGVDPTAKLLQDTGRLRASFTPFSNARTAGIGSDLLYSRPHDEGKGNLPQRRMLPEPPEVVNALRELYERHTQEVARSVTR